jgi:hypothetical protein
MDLIVAQAPPALLAARSHGCKMSVRSQGQAGAHHRDV